MPTDDTRAPADGWVLMPREPTDAMIEAGLEALREHTQVIGIDRDPLFVWRYMLSAAPAPTVTENVTVAPVGAPVEMREATLKEAIKFALEQSDTFRKAGIKYDARGEFVMGGKFNAKGLGAAAVAEGLRSMLDTPSSNSDVRKEALEEAVQVIHSHRPDASFDDSSAGYVERDALLKNLAAEVRSLANPEQKEAGHD